MIPCKRKDCDSEVDETRNKRMLCKTCSDKRPPVTGKEPINFSFDDGCQDALKNSVARGDAAAVTFGLQPVAVEYSHPTMSEPSTVYGFFHTRTIEELTANLPLETGSATQFEAARFSLNLHQGLQALDVTRQHSPAATVNLFDQVKSSSVPKYLDIEGPFQTIDSRLEAAFDIDFRFKPELVPRFAKLFAGAIVQGDLPMIILTCEAYPRAASLDLHCESTGKSLPAPGVPLFIGIVDESDGSAIKKKFKLGTKYANILVTASATLGTETVVCVGPETDIPRQQFSARSAVHFRQHAVEEYLAAADDDASSSPVTLQSVGELRQLVSRFDDISTYQPYRATVPSLKQDLFQPATIFTLCDLPVVGYGTSNNSAERLGSRILQKVGLAPHLHDGRLKLGHFEAAIRIYDIASVDHLQTKSWAPLHQTVSGIKELLNANETVSFLKLATDCRLSNLAGQVNKSLSKANSKIKANIESQLKALY